MTRDVHAVASDVDAEAAWHHMRRAGVRHLVVLDPRDEVVGVISDRDLGAHPAASLARQTVGELMSATPVLATADMEVRDAAKLMHDHVIGCLPVVADKQLIGIMTTTDILGMVAEMPRPPEPEAMVRGGRILRR